MAREQYIEKRFNAASERLIAVMDAICEDYQAQGYVLTVRQLYYQLVAKALIPNTEESYKRVTSLVNDARLAGLMDWDAIEDRTRAFIRRAHWSSGASILDSCIAGYHEDLWAKQDCRLYVVVEKEALAGVLERICNELDVPLLAARGYPSGTVLRAFVEDDIMHAINNGQSVQILHLGDHDPSGMDMTRDLEERIALFARGEVNIELTRIALNMDQIDELNPPENPAKSTDARFKAYRDRFGDSSWELDALKPEYLTNLVREHAERFIDPDRWSDAKAAITKVKRRLAEMAKEFR
jgi:hypothetical protein